MNKRLVKISTGEEKYQRICYDIAQDVIMISGDEDHGEILYEVVSDIIDHINQHSLTLTDREKIIMNYFQNNKLELTYRQVYADIEHYIIHD